MPAIPGGGGGLAPDASRRVVSTSWAASAVSRRASAGTMNDTLARFLVSRKTLWAPDDLANGISVDAIISGTLGGSPLDYDLTSLADESGGGTITFAKVRLMVLHALPTNLHTMTLLASSATNPWNAAAKDVVLPPNAMMVLENPLVAGYAVSGGAKTFRVSGTSGDQFEAYLGGS